MNRYTSPMVTAYYTTNEAHNSSSASEENCSGASEYEDDNDDEDDDEWQVAKVEDASVQTRNRSAPGRMPPCHNSDLTPYRDGPPTERAKSSEPRLPSQGACPTSTGAIPKRFVSMSPNRPRCYEQRGRSRSRRVRPARHGSSSPPSTEHDVSPTISLFGSSAMLTLPMDDDELVVFREMDTSDERVRAMRERRIYLTDQWYRLHKRAVSSILALRRAQQELQLMCAEYDLMRIVHHEKLVRHKLTVRRDPKPPPPPQSDTDSSAKPKAGPLTSCEIIRNFIKENLHFW